MVEHQPSKLDTWVRFPSPARECIYWIIGKCTCTIKFHTFFLQVKTCFNMREWLSGGAPPCQGGGRGFDPRLALFLFGSGSPILLGFRYFRVSEKL